MDLESAAQEQEKKRVQFGFDEESNTSSNQLIPAKHQKSDSRANILAEGGAGIHGRTTQLPEINAPYKDHDDRAQSDQTLTGYIANQNSSAYQDSQPDIIDSAKPISPQEDGQTLTSYLSQIKATED